VSGVGVVLLLAADAIGLVLVPLGLPGLWVMVLGVLGYGWATDFRTVGVGTIALVLGLAAAGEVIETWLGFRLARRYGGSSRAGWGALVIAGAAANQEITGSHDPGAACSVVAGADGLVLLAVGDPRLAPRP